MLAWPLSTEYVHTFSVRKKIPSAWSIANITSVFTARCYASAVLAMGLCPSVCHKSEFY